MLVKIQTSRFGELEVKKNDILVFNEGILGLENLKKFFVIDPGDKTLILWLQSTEEPSVAFPIIEPVVFKPDYSVNLLPAELTSLQLENASDAKIYSILTIPQDIALMSANLKAPLIINSKNNQSRQIVLQDNKLPIRFEMYKLLKTYISNSVSDDGRRTTVEIKEEEILESQGQTLEQEEAPQNHPDSSAPLN